MPKYLVLALALILALGGAALTNTGAVAEPTGGGSDPGDPGPPGRPK